MDAPSSLKETDLLIVTESFSSEYPSPLSLPQSCLSVFLEVRSQKAFEIVASIFLEGIQSKVLLVKAKL